jgi:hypothetical protein
MHPVWRFVWAAIGGGLAMGIHIYASFRAEPEYTLLRWGNTVDTGVTFGVLIGLLALFASEFPARLRGAWPLWARAALSVAVGIIGGTLIWMWWEALHLQRDDLGLPLLISGGAGLALGFVLLALFKMPSWLAVVITAAATYIPIFIAFQAYQANTKVPALLYYDDPQQIFTVAIPFCILIALGGHAQAVWEDVKPLLKRQA